MMIYVGRINSSVDFSLEFNQLTSRTIIVFTDFKSQTVSSPAKHLSQPKTLVAYSFHSPIRAPEYGKISSTFVRLKQPLDAILRAIKKKHRFLNDFASEVPKWNSFKEKTN